MLKYNEFAAQAEHIAREYETLYVHGCVGAPIKLLSDYTKNLSFNQGSARKAKIAAAAGDDFGFDCSGLVKAILWGWCGDTSKEYGGATYQSNGVPDINADTMIARCKDVSTDFSNIQIGELVWIKGHCGVYIGCGMAVECTHRWADGVQITAVHNIGTKSGYNGRLWTKHGKLPYVEYSVESVEKPTEPEKKPTTTTGADYTLGMRNLKRGMEGEDVRALQILLAGRGCNGNMYTPDGKFGPNTEGAVKLYQQKNGLSVDGIAGVNTMRKLTGRS